MLSDSTILRDGGTLYRDRGAGPSVQGPGADYCKVLEDHRAAANDILHNIFQYHLKLFENLYISKMSSGKTATLSSGHKIPYVIESIHRLRGVY